MKQYIIIWGTVKMFQRKSLYDRMICCWCAVACDGTSLCDCSVPFAVVLWTQINRGEIRFAISLSSHFLSFDWITHSQLQNNIDRVSNHNFSLNNKVPSTFENSNMNVIHMHIWNLYSIFKVKGRLYLICRYLIKQRNYLITNISVLLVVILSSTIAQRFNFWSSVFQK